MFLEKLLDDYSYQLLLEKYGYNVINDINRNNFLSIYKLLKNNKFYFINDIVVNYFEIFKLDYDIILESIERLKDNNVNYIEDVCNNMCLLIDIINDVLEDSL